MKTYKYRIYPSKAQETQLNRQLELCRWVYNKTLETRKNSYEQNGISLSYYDTKKMLPIWKADKPDLKQTHSMVLQDVTMRVELAFQAFFRRIKSGEAAAGYPRFKGYGRYDSMTYPQYGNGARLDGNMLILSKVGSVKVKLHRELCGGGPLGAKTVCIRRAAGNKWYVTISCAPSGHPPLLPLPYEPKAVGIDVGLQTFATLSTGEKIANPRFFKGEQKALAIAQRRMEKFAKGTPERSKRRLIVSRIHTRIANKRSNFAHQVARQLVNTYGTIVFEKLAVIDMMANHTKVFGNKLNKSIADIAWSQLAQFTAYKAADAGRLFLQVDPRNTSKKCSRCSALVPKDLGVRIHDCPHCGLVLDRDHNAAINILALGLQGVNAGSPDEVVEAQAL